MVSFTYNQFYKIKFSELIFKKEKIKPNIALHKILRDRIEANNLLNNIRNTSIVSDDS